MIEEAKGDLAVAARAGQIGRCQLGAAIQSAHAQRASTGQTDWNSIALLYAGLVRLAPSLGAHVGRAAAVAEASSAHEGMAVLQAIPVAAVMSYQPYWALLAPLYQRMGRSAEASEALNRAIGLCEDQAVRDYLGRGGCRAHPERCRFAHTS